MWIVGSSVSKPVLSGVVTVSMGLGIWISSARTHVRCSSPEQKVVQLCLLCRLYRRVQVPVAQSGATDSSSRGVAGHSHNYICLKLQLWLWLWRWRRWCCLVHNRLALHFVVALVATLGHVRMVRKNCTTNVLVGALNHGVDHLSEYLHGRTLPSIKPR